MEQRYHAVMEVISGAPVTEVARRYGVSRQAVHGWLGRYEREGLTGLADHSHRPAHQPRQLDAQIEALICQMRGAHPRWGPRRLLFELGKAKVSPAAVPVDHLPGAGPPSAGARPQAQAPPPGLQALAARGADAAMADGRHRLGVPGRWHGTEADLRDRRSFPVLRDRRRGPPGYRPRHLPCIHRRHADLRHPEKSSRTTASSSPAGSASPARPRCCSSGSAARTASGAADQAVLADHHREGGTLAPDPANRLPG